MSCLATLRAKILFSLAASYIFSPLASAGLPNPFTLLPTDWILKLSSFLRSMLLI